MAENRRLFGSSDEQELRSLTADKSLDIAAEVASNTSQMYDEFIQLCHGYINRKRIFSNDHTKVAELVIEDLNKLKPKKKKHELLAEDYLAYLACYYQALCNYLIEKKSEKFKAALDYFASNHPDFIEKLAVLIEPFLDQILELQSGFSQSNKLVFGTTLYGDEREKIFTDPDTREFIGGHHKAKKREAEKREAEAHSNKHKQNPGDESDAKPNFIKKNRR